MGDKLAGETWGGVGGETWMGNWGIIRRFAGSIWMGRVVAFSVGLVAAGSFWVCIGIDSMHSIGAERIIRMRRLDS